MKAFLVYDRCYSSGSSLADFMRFIANVMSFKFLAKKQISTTLYITQLSGFATLLMFVGHHLNGETYKTEGSGHGLVCK